jgi:hypothetical protein
VSYNSDTVIVDVGGFVKFFFEFSVSYARPVGQKQSAAWSLKTIPTGKSVNGGKGVKRYTY